MLLDNIWIINLDRSKDRIDEITNNFNKYKIKFKRFSAVDGSKTPIDNIINETSPLCRKILCNFGIIGCALSHKKLWKQLVNDTVDYYIVLEDDVKIDENFGKIVTALEEKIKIHNIDFLSLHCINIGCNIKQNVFTIDDYNFGKPLFPLSTVGYIISKNGAKILSQEIDKVNYHIDFEIAIVNLKNKLNYFTSDSPIIKTSLDSTTIGTTSYNIIPLLLDKLNLKYLSWLSTVPVLTINLTYVINLYSFVLISLLVLNNTIWKNNNISSFIFIEFFLYIFC